MKTLARALGENSEAPLGSSSLKPVFVFWTSVCFIWERRKGTDVQ